jgi:putative ABC transport system ATP-binding protein
MAIKLANIRFCYPQRPHSPVLNIPSWSLNSAERVFIHGPSGGGKSTLLSLLCGLLPISTGCIEVMGQRLDTMTSRQRDRFRVNHIGYVFQQFNLIPYLHAIDNLRLASHFAKTMKKSYLIEEIKTLLLTLNVNEQDWLTPTRQLSIGQQQRIAIARALINKPKLVIADEPTSALDHANRDAFMTLLMSIVAEYDMTLVFVSHDMSLAKHFTRVEALTEINCVGESI